MIHHPAETGIAPEEIRSIRERLNLTQAEAGEFIGGGPRAFTKYEAGTVKPAASVINLLRVLDAHPNALAALERSPRRRAVAHRPLPFEISGEDIERLTESDMHELLRRLLRAEALANELPLDGIHVSSATSNPDGGEDGRIEWNGGRARTPYLPGRLCQFQAKAGNIGPTKAAKEASKPMVQQVLRSGGHYIVLCAKRYVRRLIETREAAIRDAVRHADIDVRDHQVDFRDADRTADWVNNHAPVAMWVKERTQPGTIGPFRSWSHWADRAEHAGSPWFEDDRLHPISTWLCERVTEPRRVARFVGLWGIGKSRLALEALNAASSFVSDAVMYAVDSESSPGAINDVVQTLSATGTRAIVVVDECSLERHRVLTGMVSRSSSQLSLITIDDEIPSGTRDETTLVVSEAPLSVTESIVNYIAPHLESEDERRVVRFSTGFPKIATRVSHVWGTTPITYATDDDLVDSFVLGRDPTERDLRLKSAALLATLGPFRIEPNADSQLPATASLGRQLTPDDLHASLVALVDRGAAQRRGGYVVLQPRPIAMRLAERQWKEWREEKWEEALAGSIGKDLRVSAARSLALLNDTEIARKVVTHVCRAGGSLDVQGIAKTGNPEVLSFLAEVDTASVARHIARHLDETDPSSTVNLARPALVRALQKICFDSSTFSAGARLLLRLATAEQRATDSMTDRLRRVFRGGPSGAAEAFQSLFPVCLGNTAADGIARMSLLDELLDSDDPIERSIVADALVEGLQTAHFSRQIGPEAHGSRPALAEWHPVTQQELNQYVEGCVIRLGELAKTDDRAAAAARAGLALRLPSLIAAGYLDAVETAILQVAAAPRPWTGALNTIDRILASETRTLDDDTASRLQELATKLRPRTLAARVRAQVTDGLLDPCFDSATRDDDWNRSDSVRELAYEALRQPAKLKTVLADVSRGRQSMAYEFGKALAQGDDPLNWLEPIVQAVVAVTEGNRNYDLLTGYAAGAYTNHPDDIFGLKRRAAESPDLAPCLPLLCRRVGITPDDLTLVLQALDDGLLPRRNLMEWRMQGSMDQITDAAIAPFFDALINHSDEAFEIAVHLLDPRVDHDPRTLDRLSPQIHGVAKNATRWTSIGRDMTAYHFERIMSRVLQGGRHNPAACVLAVELSKALVKADAYHGVRLMEPIIPTLLSDFPEISWPLIGQSIISDDRMSSRLSYVLGRSPFRPTDDALILCLPQDAMFAWCHAHPGRAPAFVARVLPLLATSSENSPPCLHPALLRLLVEFGDRDDVDQAIKENIEALGWVGSMTSRYAQFEAPLRALDSHGNPRARDWARRMLKYLDNRTLEATYLDEEREVRAELSW